VVDLADVDPHAERAVPTVVSHETDSFAQSFPAQLVAEFVRDGPGAEPSTTKQAVIGGLTVSRIGFGFDVRSHIEVDDSSFAVAQIVDAPRGARWGDIDLAPGQVRSLGSARTHLGISSGGLATLAVVIDAGRLRETADLLGHVVDPDVMVGPLARSPEFDRVFDDIAIHLDHPETALPHVTTRTCDHLLAAVARTAAASDQSTSRSFAVSRDIVTRCLDYARSTSASTPSTVELCGVAGVSDRRVRSAFLDVFEMPPNRYFRLVGLNDARALLTEPESDATVTDIAHRLGFFHLSRFSRYYRARFGEYPSDTLQAHRAR